MNKRPDVIILNGPMGVGKTATGIAIAEKYPGTAFIDGDWCMDLHPFIGSRETREMAVDNILHMIRNYRDCSVCDRIVLSWLMDDDRIYGSIIDGIKQLGLEVKSVTLICSEEELKSRWKNDRDCPWRTDEWLRCAVSSLEFFAKKVNCLDTSGLSVEEIAELMI